MPLNAASLAQALAATLEQAANDGLPPVCIAIADAHGELFMLQRSIDAPARSIRIAQAKAYTAVRMGMSTAQFQRRLIDERLSVADFMDAGYTSLPGGVPFHDSDGGLLGGVGVSGRSPAQDEALAQALIARLDSAAA